MKKSVGEQTLEHVRSVIAWTMTLIFDASCHGFPLSEALAARYDI